MTTFSQCMGDHQVQWRRGQVSTEERGKQNGRPCQWVLPPTHWEEGLWQGIRSPSPNSIAAYLIREKADRHTSSHNPKSSWVACANLYFPFRTCAEDRGLLAGFLRSAVSTEVQTLDAVELEYAEPGPLHPAELLGEMGGNRGKGQTSPDIAFIVNDADGIILTESKLTEHSFYACSARTREDKPGRPANPDPTRCRNSRVVADNPRSICHQVAWGRKYWDHLKGAFDREALARLEACPAAFAGYQLFRQQALAEGYTLKYRFVASAVAYDERNTQLVDSLQGTGIGSFPDGWSALWKGKSIFAAWTHQAWVDWVRRHDTGKWQGWLEWISARYGY